MITFKQFISEDDFPHPKDGARPARHVKPRYRDANRYSNIDGTLLDFLKKHCSDAMWMIKNDTPMWRGSRTDSKYPSVIDPTTSERKSSNVYNHYTVLMDNSPHLSEYPKRSRSIIASNVKFDASGYGKVYAVIPFNGVKIGIVGERDLWEVWVKYFGSQRSMDDLATDLNRLFDNPTIDKFKKYDELLKKDDPMAVKNFKRTFHYADGDDHYNFLDSLYLTLSPKNTGFKLATTADQQSLMSRKSEVWIGGKSVMIPNDVWNKLQFEIGEGNLHV